MADKQTYRVKDGYTFGKDKDKKAGDVVMLTEQEAAGFLDKLELVESKAKAPTTKTNEDKTKDSSAKKG